MRGCGKPAVGCKSREELLLHGASCDVIGDSCCVAADYSETRAVVCCAGRDGTSVRGVLQEAGLGVAGRAAVFSGDGVQVLALQRSVGVRRRPCCVGSVAVVVCGVKIPRTWRQQETVWASKTHFL